jgi:P27 family predicted phage terminase small subunit
MTRRKPTALKLFEGNPGKRKLNNQEPKYETLSIDSAPKDLNEDGRRAWFELGNQLARIGLLQTVDTNIFWRYCDTFARWLRISRYLEAMVGTANNPTGIRQAVTEQVYRQGPKGGLVPVLNPDGTPQLRVKFYRTLPEVAEYHRLSETLRKLEGELGLTPQARSKLFIPDSGGRYGRQEEKDPFDE